MEYDPNQDPERQFGGGGQLPAPTADTSAPRLTGPITGPNDPRLTDPQYASDPEVLKFLDTIYAPGGKVYNPTPGTTGWNPYTLDWNPAASGGDSGGGGGGGGGATAPTGSSVGDISQFPTFNPPTPTPQQGLSAPSPYTFTPFVNGTFTAPTLEEAQNQPGYKFGLQQGQQALENSAAERGTLRGGGTLKDLFGYTNAAAEQNYGNVFNQDLTTFNTNEGNRFGAWAANTGQGLQAYNTNWGVNKDVNASGNAANQQNYTNAYQNAAGVFNPQFQASQLTFADSYDRWLAKLNSLTQIASAGAS